MVGGRRGVGLRSLSDFFNFILGSFFVFVFVLFRSGLDCDICFRFSSRLSDIFYAVSHFVSFYFPPHIPVFLFFPVELGLHYVMSLFISWTCSSFVVVQVISPLHRNTIITLVFHFSSFFSVM